MQGLGRDLTEIAFGFLGIAFVALLINRSQDTANVINAAGSVFGGLISTVTLQGSPFTNGYGNFAMQGRL